MAIAIVILLVPLACAVLATLAFSSVTGIRLGGRTDGDEGHGYFVVFFLAIVSVPAIGLAVILASLARP